MEIVENPMNTTHFAGGNIFMNCSATGIPSATFVWYKNEELLLNDERVEIFNTILVQTFNEIITQSMLTLFNLNQFDDASYFCKARNPGAHELEFVATSNSAHLYVQCEHRGFLFCF